MNTLDQIADEIQRLAARMILGPATGHVYRVTAEFPDGRTWTRRFLTKRAAVKTYWSLQDPRPRYGYGIGDEYVPAKPTRIRFEIAELGPFEEIQP